MDLIRLLLYAACVTLLGVGFPWLRGLDLLDPALFVPYALLSGAFAAAAAAGRWSDEEHRHRLVQRVAAGEPAARVLWLETLRAAAFGWGSALLIVVLALATLNAINWHGQGLLPGAATGTAAAVWSVAVAALASLLGAVSALSAASAYEGRRNVRLAFVILLALYIWGGLLLPASWRDWIAEALLPERLTVLVWGSLPWFAVAVWLAWRKARRLWAATTA